MQAASLGVCESASSLICESVSMPVVRLYSASDMQDMTQRL